MRISPRKADAGRKKHVMSTPDLELAVITRETGPRFHEMTFPSYRHFLTLDRAPRHPDQGDTRVVAPFGVGATLDGQPVGLALCEVGSDNRWPEVLSVFVRQDLRNQGIGTQLLGRLGDELARRGGTRLEAVYMTGKPGIEAMERVLAKCGWEAPVARTISVRFSLQEASTTPWFGRISLPNPPFEIFSWSELTENEREYLKSSDAAEKWIATGLEPWRHDAYGYEPISSVGLRYHGQVVGWVINHRVGDDVVRFTCSFMRADLSKRGRILPLYTESLSRLREAGVRMCSLVTPVSYGPMVDFLKRRCAAWVSFVGETRGAGKQLVPAVVQASRSE
jgi:GNAT superfamily N-acetyltransferase/predicted GNAT family acetyltransferase